MRSLVLRVGVSRAVWRVFLGVASARRLVVGLVYNIANLERKVEFAILSSSLDVHCRYLLSLVVVKCNNHV